MAAQVFNVIDKIDREFVPILQPIYTASPEHIYITTSYIDKKQDSGFKILRFDSNGSIISTFNRGFYYDLTDDTFFYQDDIEQYEGQFYSFGYGFVKYNKSDSIFAVSRLVCSLDINTFKPNLKLAQSVFLGFGYSLPVGYYSTRFPIIQSHKMHHTFYFWEYDANFIKYKYMTDVYTSYNFKSKNFSIKKLQPLRDNYRAILSNVIPYDNYFYSFTNYGYNSNSNKIEGMIYKYDYNLNFIDSFQPAFKDTNLLFSISSINSFAYNIRKNNKTIGFQTSNFLTKKGTMNLDSIGLFIYSLDSGKLEMIKKIETDTPYSPKFFYSYGINDIIENLDGSIYLSFIQDNNIKGVSVKVIKLDSNLNTLWSRIYRDSPGYVNYVFENKIFRVISDSNGGMLMPFVALDRYGERQLYVLWIDKDGNTKKMELQDVSTNNLKENTNRKDFSVYPNPASNTLFIDAPNLNRFSYSMYDYTGRQLLNDKYKWSIDISHLCNGIYFIQIKSENGAIQSKKFEIKR